MYLGDKSGDKSWRDYSMSCSPSDLAQWLMRLTLLGVTRNAMLAPDQSPPYTALSG
jgi:hypothetical protein